MSTDSPRAASATPSIGTRPPPVGTHSTCGIQVRSTYKTNPSFGFGKSTREVAQKRFISDEHCSKVAPPNVPGPGTYKHRISTGKQPSTFQKSSPRYGFGKSERFETQLRDLKRAGAVPGPGAYVIC